MKTFYDVLDLRQNCTDSEIKRNYHKLASKYHPDKNINDIDQAEIKFKEISEAYQILSDPQKKYNYDRYLDSLRFKNNTSYDDYFFNNQSLNNQTFMDPFQLFDQIFNDHSDNNNSFFNYPNLHDNIFSPSLFDNLTTKSSYIHQTNSTSNNINGVINEQIFENNNGVITEITKRNGKIISKKIYNSRDPQKKIKNKR